MPEPILCPRCGASCEETQEFCNSCGCCLTNLAFDDLFADAPRAGRAVHMPEPPAAVQPAEQETDVPKTAPKTVPKTAPGETAGQSAGNRKQRPHTLRLAGVIALVGCLAGGMALAWRSRNQQTPEVQRSEPVFYMNGEALMLSLPQKDPICISAQPETDQADFDAGQFYQNTVKISEDGSRVFFLRSLYGTEAMLSYIDLSAPETVHDATKISSSNLIRAFDSWRLIYNSDPETEIIRQLNPVFSLLDKHGGSVVFRDEDNSLCVWNGETGTVTIIDAFSKYNTLGFWTSPQPDSETDMICTLNCDLSDAEMNPLASPKHSLSLVCYPGADLTEQFTAEENIAMWIKPWASSRYALFYRQASGDDRLLPYILYFGDRAHPGMTSGALPTLDPNAAENGAFKNRGENGGINGNMFAYDPESFDGFYVFSTDITIERGKDGVYAYIGSVNNAEKQKQYSVDRIYSDHTALLDYNYGDAFYFWTQNENGSKMVEIGKKICVLAENAPAALGGNPDSRQYQFVSPNGTFPVTQDLGAFGGLWLSGDGSRVAADAGAFYTGSITEEHGMLLSKASDVTGVQNVWFIGESDYVYATQTDMYYREKRLAAYDADSTQAECAPDGSALYYYTDVTGSADGTRRGTLYRFSGGSVTLIAEQTAERFITENGVYYIAPDGETDALWFCGADSIAVRLGEADTMLFTVNEPAK